MNEIACNTMFISISSTAKIIGVSTKTMRRWDAGEKLKPKFRTKGGHRRYDWNRILIFIEEKPDPTGVCSGEKLKRAAIYARVSSAKQKHDLNRAAVPPIPDQKNSVKSILEVEI